MKCSRAVEDVDMLAHKCARTKETGRITEVLRSMRRWRTQNSEGGDKLVESMNKSKHNGG